MKKSGLAILMILAALVLAWGTRAEAQTFLGEFCWQMTGTENETGPIIPPETALARMGVTYLGGSYYLLQGIANSTDGPVILNGTGIFYGSQVLMSLSLSQDHTPIGPWRDSSTVQVTLNASSLSGTWWDVGSSFNPTTRTFGPMYGAGTWTFTSCP
jgi:hypothetical protein